MVQAHHRAQHAAADFVLGQPVGWPAVLARGQPLVLHRQHAALQVEAVDGVPVRLALHPADMEAAEAAWRRAVVGEPQAQSVGGVEEQLLRCLRQHLLRRGHIEGDVAFAGPFLLQRGRQAGGIRVGMADQQAAPAAVDALRLTGIAALAGQVRLQALVGRCLAALQALVVGSGAHG